MEKAAKREGMRASNGVQTPRTANKTLALAVVEEDVERFCNECTDEDWQDAHMLCTATRVLRCGLKQRYVFTMDRSCLREQACASSSSNDGAHISQPGAAIHAVVSGYPQAVGHFESDVHQQWRRRERHASAVARSFWEQACSTTFFCMMSIRTLKTGGATPQPISQRSCADC